MSGKAGEFFGAVFGFSMLLLFTVAGLDRCAPTALPLGEGVNHEQLSP